MVAASEGSPKMKRYNILPVLALTIWSSTFSIYVAACTCLYQGEFIEYSKKNPLVVRGIIEYNDFQVDSSIGNIRSMYLLITEVVKGDISYSRIRLSGGDGLSCEKRISRTEYPDGSEHFFILRNNREVQSLLGCGEVSVKIVDSNIEGVSPIIGGVSKYQMPIIKFKEVLNQR